MQKDTYQKLVKSAIKEFWETRTTQKGKTADATNRSAVTGGKQFDGFLKLLTRVALDLGIPSDCIYIKANQLPGYFRPTKEWDFLILTPSGKLLVAIELKSQVGSFGNNFNNRTEEALGSALDIWTAYRENAFPNQASPWLGYLFVLERSAKSSAPVRITQPYFKVFPEFENTSYEDRYKIFCQKLMLERHYSHCGLIWTTADHKYGVIDDNLSIDSFIAALKGHLLGQLHELKKKQ